MRDEYEIKGTFTKKEGLELLADLLNIPREISIYESVIDDARCVGVKINQRDLQNMGVDRMHNWYQLYSNGKYFKNIHAIDAEKAKKMILEAHMYGDTRLNSKVKASYEDLNAILTKKKDVGKAAFQELMKANFVGEEILLNVYDNSKWDNVVPCAGVITEVTEDYLKYKPYTLEETVKKLTIKKKSILQGVREEHLNVKYWNKNNLQEEKTLKKFKGNEPTGSSYFDVRAKENNHQKFNFRQADNNNYGLGDLEQVEKDKGCWHYEMEILTGSIARPGGWVFSSGKTEFDYIIQPSDSMMHIENF